MYRKIFLKTTRLFNNAYPYIATAIFLTISILLILRHELWRDEIISWHFGSEAATFSEFVKTVNTNGNNTYAWFAILYFVSHFITQNPESMKIIHLAISTVSIFLILKYAPFNKIIRVMIIFGYFFFYEYSIISRNYALGILFIVIFCILYKNKYNNILPIAIVLFFMGQANILSFMISLSLFLMLAIEFIIDRKYIAKNIKKVYIILAILIVVCEISFVYLQINSQISITTAQAAGSGIFNRSIEENRISAMLVSGGLIDAYIPLPQLILNFWDGRRLVTYLLSNYSFLYTFLFSTILFIIPIFIIKRKVIIAYLAGSILIMFIPFFIYGNYIRHFGHLFIIFIFCLWLSNINKNDRYLINFKGKANKILQITLFAIILIPSLIASAAAFNYDWEHPFSNGKYVAEYIEENFNKDEIMIVGYIDYITETVSGYLNKDIYYPNSKSIKKLVDWNNRIANVSDNEIFREANSFIDNYNQILIISSVGVEEQELPLNYYLVKYFGNAIVSSENYFLYVFNRDDVMDKSNLIYRIDYSNFNDYWTPINDCKFVIKDKIIHITVESEDPYFESIFPIEFKEKKPLLMIISVESLVDAEFQIFYKRTGNVYNGKDSRSFALFKGNNNIYIRIPYSGDLESIRIDPIDKNQNCIIDKIEFYD